MRRALTVVALALVLSSMWPTAAGADDVFDRVSHGFADSAGVKIHYATLGRGPLVVMIHGFPDFWYTWRHQMAALATDFQVVAVDLRGYNLSDKPAGVEHYDMTLLEADVAAVIKHLGREKAILVGHDWGGAVAWRFAMNRPQMTDKLVILNLPHPKGFGRELANNPQQRQGSAYARAFREKNATDPDVFFGGPTALPELPAVKAPVLMFHGLQDRAMSADALNGTWNWVQRDLTLVTIPSAGHFVQQDAADLVTRTMKWWLGAD